MRRIIRSRLYWGLLLGFVVAVMVGAITGSPIGIDAKRVEAAEEKPKAMFVNLVNFPPLKPGKEAEFLEWFRWSNEVYAKHKGFISRTLLRSMGKSTTYAAVVEHESKETFMAMHHSPDREEAFRRVEPLLERKPTPHFYEVVTSYRK